MVAVTIRKGGDTVAGCRDGSEKEIGIKAIRVWTSVHALVGLSRSGDAYDSKTKNLKWVDDSLEDYLKMITFR